MPELRTGGRAARLFLLGRIATARRGADLLDRKRQLLRREVARLDEDRTVARGRLEAACAELDVWAARTAALGGPRDVTIAGEALGSPAEVEVHWENTMGTLHPSSHTSVLPSLRPLDAAGLTSALPPTAAACREALDGALAAAVAEDAVRRLSGELALTTRRVRAITRIRLPALEDALAVLNQRLDETDREERAVGRWAWERSERAGAAGSPRRP